MMGLRHIISSSRRKPGSSDFSSAARCKSKALGPGFRRDDGRRRTSSFLVCFALLSGLALSQAAFAVDPLPFKNHAEELRFQALTKQLRCLVCQNESLADSNAPLAADLRRDVFQQMQAGKSDDEIKAWLTARYSDFVLYDPPLHAGTWLLWFGPMLVLLAGGAAIIVVVRRRARSAALPANTPKAAVDAEDDW
jgi:cytochrome c-type biogenesis protein CcmH